MKRLFVAFCIVAGLSQVGPVLADPPVAEWERSILRVISVDQGTGTGWVVNSSGYVATNWHVVEGANQLKVVLGGTQNVYDAELVWKGNSDLDLAVLYVPGFSAEAFSLHTDDPERGQTSYTAGFPGLADSFVGRMNTEISVYRGTISLVAENTEGIRIIQHDTRVNAGNSGGPLLDECGRVLGLTSWSQNTLSRNSDDVVWASVHISELARQLDNLGIGYDEDSSACELTSSGPSGEVTDTQAREEASQASETAQEASRRAEGTEQALDELKKFVLGGGIALWILLAVVLVLVLRRPRQQIVKAIESASRSIRRTKHRSERDLERSDEEAKRMASDNRRGGHVILSGFSAGGRTIRIELAIENLKKAGKGVSLGRAADLVDQVIEDKEISRRHARILWDGRSVCVEDLNSTNGTQVNGRSLTPFEPVSIASGDVVKVGQIELNVNVN